MPDRALPYDLPSHPAKRHSRAPDRRPRPRAPRAAMLKAIGFTDEDLARPIIGVATNWIETMPCNYNQRRLAEAVKEGIRAAGGTPMEFNTIAVSDGVSMGTEGMKASPRQPRGRRRLDRDWSPAATSSTASSAWSAATRRSRARRWPSLRLDLPGPRPLQRHDLPGRRTRARTPTSSRVFEAVGAYRAGKISLEELYEIESASCPGAGACGGQYTANTMSMVMEFIGPLAGRPQRHPGRGPGQGRGRPPLRRARRWTSCRATSGRRRS